MKFTLTLNLGNQAMTEPLDVAEALRYVANRLEDNGTFPDSAVPVRDLNGATVGSYQVEEV